MQEKNWTWVDKVWVKKTRHVEKLTISKKSTFFSNLHETWWKWLPHEVNIFIRLHKNWTKIENFFKFFKFWTCLIFFYSYFRSKNRPKLGHGWQLKQSKVSFQINTNCNHVVVFSMTKRVMILQAFWIESLIRFIWNFSETFFENSGVKHTISTTLEAFT